MGKDEPSSVQVQSLLENFPGIYGGMVNRSLLHQHAVENVVSVVNKHGQESFLGLPAYVLLEVGNGILWA